MMILASGALLASVVGTSPTLAASRTTKAKATTKAKVTPTTAPATTQAPTTKAPVPASTAAPASREALSVGADLASVCPNPIVIQTGWYPQPDRGFLYELVGDGGKIDVSGGKYSGPSKADPRVTIEVRGGGPMKGFQAGFSLAYTDPSILLVDQNLDAMVTGFKKFPTVGVLAPFEKFAQILMWNPDTLQIGGPADVKKSGATIYVASNATYADVLVGLGKIDAKQVDKTYAFSPARFIAENGKLLQQGFATNEPFAYQNTVAAWKKPVKYLYVADMGYPLYGTVLSARPDVISDRKDCLSRLVPVIQRTLVNYVSNPTATNKLLVELSQKFNAPVPLTAAEAAAAVKTMAADGLLSNGTNGYVGDFDYARVQQIFDAVMPIFINQGVDVRGDLRAREIFTNVFIDPKVGL